MSGYSSAPTLYEWCGGLPALTRMTRIFYGHYVPQDPLLAPVFAGMEEDHPDRVAAWLAPLFWGPAVVLALVGLVVADVALLTRGDFWGAVGELFATPTIALLIYGLLTAAAVVHELGHAAACRYGGARPGEISMSTFGHPGRYTYCIAEAEEASPWDPLHVERGLPRRVRR